MEIVLNIYSFINIYTFCIFNLNENDDTRAGVIFGNKDELLRNFMFIVLTRFGIVLMAAILLPVSRNEVLIDGDQKTDPLESTN